jgi:hypothetical protein
MMTDKAELHFSRSDFPNLMPLTAQFAAPGEFRATRSMQIPTKVSQLVLDLFTAVVIAASKAPRLIGSRVVGSGVSDIGTSGSAVIVIPPIECHVGGLS